jgi:hypothetical protein
MQWSLAKMAKIHFWKCIDGNLVYLKATTAPSIGGYVSQCGRSFSLASPASEEKSSGSTLNPTVSCSLQFFTYLRGAWVCRGCRHDTQLPVSCGLGLDQCSQTAEHNGTMVPMVVTPSADRVKESFI